MPPAWVIEECMNQHGAFYVESPPPVVPPVKKESIVTVSTEEETHCETESENGSSSTSLQVIVTAGGDECDSKVRFDLRESLHEVPARQDMTEEDMSTIWYRPCDFANIASWNRMTVKIFRQYAKEFGGANDICQDILEGDQCLRGLEHRLKGVNALRGEIKTNAIYSVLGEQARRKREGLPKDPQKLANVYSEHTYSCISDAINKGIRDEMAAKDLSEVDNAPQPQQASQAKSRRTSHLYAFDDFDVRSLRDDLSAASDHIPVPIPNTKISTSAAPSNKATTAQREDDEESFRVKAKREKRGSISFSKFFKKKGSKSKSKKQKEAAATTSSAEPQLPARRRHRRSSM